jgi:hypothetical protein
MARWLVHTRDRQFAVEGMAELRTLAQKGEVEPGDLVQPPGAVDWSYALEIAELKQHLRPPRPSDDDDAPASSGTGATVGVIAVLGLVAVAGGVLAFRFASLLPDPQKRLEDQVGLEEMVVTDAGAQLLGEPAEDAASVAALAKGGELDLMAKRGEFYKARDQASGREGWVRVDQVMPMYLLGGGEVLRERDPLYNPDRYVFVQNASWMQLPEQQEQQLTVFQFRLQNESIYDMTDLVMVAKIKDSRGQELERIEFRVEGVVPAGGSTMVGTVADPKDAASRRLVTQTTFEVQAKDDPELSMQYTEGVEVKMQTADFTEASIDILELRAVPKEPAQP